MFTKSEKGFFANTARGASRLSTCPIQRGAALIDGGQIQSAGHNRRIVKDKEWEISAIYDVIFSCCNKDLTGYALFSTCFPSLDDMKLIVSVGITYIYFFGKSDDLEAIELLNNLPKNRIPLEIIHLE